MTRQRSISTLFVVVGLAFFVLALSQAQSRVLRIAVAVVFVAIGVHQGRRRQPPPGTPGA